MNRAIFVFFDRVIMSSYFLVTLFVVATAIMGSAGVDVKALAALFFSVAGVSMGYLLIRGIFMKPAKRVIFES